VSFLLNLRGPFHRSDDWRGQRTVVGMALMRLEDPNEKAWSFGRLHAK